MFTIGSSARYSVLNFQIRLDRFGFPPSQRTSNAGAILKEHGSFERALHDIQLTILFLIDHRDCTESRCAQTYPPSPHAPPHRIS
jgi:hypothetical protein